MKDILFIDTNILYSNAYNYKKFEKSINSYKKDYVVMTAALCIEEFAGIILRESIRFLGSIVDFIENYGEVFIVDESVKGMRNQDFQGLISKAIKKKLENLFGESNIVDISRENLFDKIVERDKQKLAPFNDKGDKGFKDTAVWITFMEYAVNNKNANYFFISNDHGFIRNKIDLQKEFIAFTGINHIKFLDKLPNLVSKSIQVKEPNGPFKETLPDNMNEFREMANNILNILIYTSIDNPYDEDYVEINFETYEKFDSDILDVIIKEIPAFLFAHPFDYDFSFFDVFKVYPIKSNYRITAKTLDEVSKFYLDIESPHLRKSFIAFIVSKINEECYKEAESYSRNAAIVEDDLPF